MTEADNSSLRLINTATTLGLITLIIYILHIGRNLILPFIIALVIWYIIIQFATMFQLIRIRSFRLPYWICLLLSIIISAAILYLFFWLLTSSVANIISEAPKYQAKLQTILDYLNQFTYHRFDVKKIITDLNITQVLSKFAYFLTDVLSNFTLIVIYLLFLLLEYKTFDKKLEAICGSKSKYHTVDNIMQRIHTDINTFLKTKTMLNAIAGVASYICLLFFHVEYAEFWGVFIFLLHYIPYIGPIIAIIFVLLAATIQIDSLLVFILLGVFLVTIQFLVGNIFEPKLMGNQLNLSPIVILLSLAFWGYIWGITGMFLCVPAMVIIAIIFDNFDSTRPIAIAMSASGRGIKYDSKKKTK